MPRVVSSPVTGGTPVPPGFTAHILNVEAALHDLDAFDALLARKANLDEAKDVLPFFRDHPQLTAYLSFYSANMPHVDRLAYELDLDGQFRADAVMGDRERSRYLLVEFEDANAQSIFRRSGRRTGMWAPRFQDGYSQLVDWLCLLDGQENTPQQEDRFGARSIHVSGLLIIGRDGSSFTGSGDRRRFEWWRDHVVVNSCPVTCRTYDEVARDLRDWINMALTSAPSPPRRIARPRRQKRGGRLHPPNHLTPCTINDCYLPSVSTRAPCAEPSASVRRPPASARSGARNGCTLRS